MGTITCVDLKYTLSGSLRGVLSAPKNGVQKLFPFPTLEVWRSGAGPGAGGAPGDVGALVQTTIPPQSDMQQFPFPSLELSSWRFSLSKPKPV